MSYKVLLFIFINVSCKNATKSLKPILIVGMVQYYNGIYLNKFDIQAYLFYFQNRYVVLMYYSILLDSFNIIYMIHFWNKCSLAPNLICVNFTIQNVCFCMLFMWYFKNTSAKLSLGFKVKILQQSILHCTSYDRLKYVFLKNTSELNSILHKIENSTQQQISFFGGGS